MGDPLVDRYLAFVAGRARVETLRAAASDLKTFFTVVSKSPVDVVAADVFEFLAPQRGDQSVIRLRATYHCMMSSLKRRRSAGRWKNR